MDIWVDERMEEWMNEVGSENELIDWIEIEC